MARIKPWDMQENEGAKPFASFAMYRDLGPERSLVKVGELAGKNEGTLEVLSAKWNWVARVKEWDREQDRIKQKAYQKELEDMSKRQARQVGLVANALMQPVIALTRKLNPTDPVAKAALEKDVAKLQNMDIGTLVYMVNNVSNSLNTIIRLERTIRGEPDSVTKTEHREFKKTESFSREEKIIFNFDQTVNEYAGAAREARKRIQRGLSSGDATKDSTGERVHPPQSAPETG